MDERTDRIAAVARAVASDWGLQLGERFASSHSFIAAVGSDAILKVVRADITEYDHEPDALALWNGDHAIRLLRHDRSRRALLLERALPGDDLSGTREVEAIRVAIDVGSALWRRVPEGSPFRDVLDLSWAWLAEVEERDPDLVRAARTLLDRMALRTPRVIHGDFHHHNILRRGDGWVAIDPQPAIGEPEYDIATLLWNPVGTMPTTERISRWLAAFAAAGLDPQRMREWAIVRGVILGLPSRSDQPLHASQLMVARSLLESS